MSGKGDLLQIGGRESFMRKRYRVLLFAALTAALAVPFGFALSPESRDLTVVSSRAPSAALKAEAPAAMMVVAPRAISSAVGPAGPLDGAIPDAATLLVIGGLLVGVAALARKAL
jgi:hypothetical protein